MGYVSYAAPPPPNWACAYRVTPEYSERILCIATHCLFGFLAVGCTAFSPLTLLTLYPFSYLTLTSMTPNRFHRRSATLFWGPPTPWRGSS